MQETRKKGRSAKIVAFATVALLTLLLALPALAQVSSNYDLSWHVIAGGGGKSAGAGHTLMGTVGQPVTGRMVSASSALCSGFWCSGAALHRIFLPLVIRLSP